jgi:hypothetical protein
MPRKLTIALALSALLALVAAPAALAAADLNQVIQSCASGSPACSPDWRRCS